MLLYGVETGPRPSTAVCAMPIGFGVPAPVDAGGAGWNGSTTTYCRTCERFLFRRQKKSSRKSATSRASPPSAPPMMAPRWLLLLEFDEGAFVLELELEFEASPCGGDGDGEKNVGKDGGGGMTYWK